MKKILIAFLLLCASINAQISSITTYVGNQLPNNTSKQIMPANVRHAILSIPNNLGTISYTGFISTTYPIQTTSSVSASTYYGDGSHLTGISGGGSGTSTWYGLTNIPTQVQNVSNSGSISLTAISATGNISANKFIGDGSLLSGVATSSTTWPSIQNVPAGIVAVSDSLGGVTVTTLSARILANSISATGLTSVTGLYANTGLFGGLVLSTTSVVSLRQNVVNTSSAGYGLENPTGQSTFRWWIDATGTGGNVQMSRNGATNYFVMNATGIGIGKTASTALDVSGTATATAVSAGLLTSPLVSVTTLLTAPTVSSTVLNAQTASITNLTVTGIFSGTVVTYTTNVTNVFNVTTTLGTLDEAEISQTASGAVSLNTVSATVFNLTLTGNTSVTFTNTPVSGYSRGINIFTKQGGATGLYGFNIAGCIWSGGVTPSPTTGIGAQDDWYAVTNNQGASYHCYQNGAGMQ